jgi:hypothetical protein
MALYSAANHSNALAASRTSMLDSTAHHGTAQQHSTRKHRSRKGEVPADYAAAACTEQEGGASLQAG